MHVIGLPLLRDLGSVRNVSSLIFPYPIWLSLPPTRWLRNLSSIICGRVFLILPPYSLETLQETWTKILGGASGFQSNTLGDFVLHSEVQVIMSGSAQGSVLSSRSAVLVTRLSRCFLQETYFQPFSCEALMPLDCSVWALLSEELPSTAPLPSLPSPSSIPGKYLFLPPLIHPSPTHLLDFPCLPLPGNSSSVLYLQQRSGWRWSLGQN